MRAVNNRFFKLQLRTSDSLSRLEPEIEALCRQNVRLGSLTMSVYISRECQGENDRLSPAGSRHRQLLRPDQVDCERALGIAADVTMGQLLGLPGVVNETESDSREPSDELTRETLTAVEDALKCLNRMREVERCQHGHRTHDADRTHPRFRKDAIEEKAPMVIDDYRERLRLRVQQGLSR